MGSIRALETTYGGNGWHPHYHILLFLDSSIPLDKIAAAYEERWINACIKAGLPAPKPGVACTVQDGSYASAYVGKWGLPEEMTKSHIKHAIAGRTPMDLLRDYADGDENSGRLWREYVAAFKGQRQLWWSQGLRQLLYLPREESDEEISAQVEEPEAEVLATLTEYQRRALVNARMLCAVLEVAETNREMLPFYIEGVVRDYYRAHPEQRRRSAKREVRAMAEAAGYLTEGLQADRVPAWILARKVHRPPSPP